MSYDDDDEALEVLHGSSSCSDDEADLRLSSNIHALPLPRPTSTVPMLAYSPPTTSAIEDPQPSGSACSTARDAERPRDRIGTFFGYNGTDSFVPKAAYEAMSQRVRSLEGSLGGANRELRANGAVIAEQQATITHLAQQLQQKEALLRASEEREAMLTARERELQEREQSLETMARQLRKIRKRDKKDPVDDECPYCHGSGSQAPASSDFVRRRVRRDDDDDAAAVVGRRNPSREREPRRESGMLPRIPGARPLDDHRSHTSLGFY